MKWVDRFIAWGKSAQPVGKLEDGPLPTAMKAECAVVLILDSNGRMYQAIGPKISNAMLHRIDDPRAEIAKILDSFGFSPDSDKPPVVTLDY